MSEKETREPRDERIILISQSSYDKVGRLHQKLRDTTTDAWYWEY